MFLFSLLPYKFGWADVELFFKMFGDNSVQNNFAIK